VPGPRWSDFGSVWKTIREVDVSAIRHEAERDVRIVCIGQPAALWWVDRFLREGPSRYPVSGDALALVPLAEAGATIDVLPACDLLVLALEAATTLGADEAAALERLAAAPRPSQVVLLFGSAADAPAAWFPYLGRGAATLIQPESSTAAAVVAGVVLGGLPAAVRLAAARRLPGLRPLFAARLTGEVSASNAAFALASGLPSIVPLLGIPISAADTIVLTKNQALMVYRLALACGAPPDFQKRMVEITPVIGGAVVWRQIAGALVGLVPGYGIVPKTAVAFGGTYLVGLAATRWYETGLLTDAERKRIVAEASAKAREAATAMVEQARAAGGKAGAQAQSGMRKAGRAAGIARAQARLATQKVREGGRKVVRRPRRGVTDGPAGAETGAAPADERAADSPPGEERA
jgi:hypothetical protein